MKELSIEEKAKRYDEALKYGRYLIDTRCKEGSDGFFHRSDLQKMFPCIEEDDEQVAQKLYKLLCEEVTCEQFEKHGLTASSALYWLEKQGEQKYPTSQPIEGEFPYVNPAETLDVEIENIWGNLSRENRFIATKDGFHEVIVHFYNWIKKQGMQNLDNSAKTCKEELKPVENNYPKYNKGDILTDGKSTYKVLSWDYTESGIAAYYMESNGCKFSWGCEEADKELKPLEQNPAWSEEDELSCFESALFTAFSDAWQSYLPGEEVNVKQWTKEHSKELLEAAKEELKEHWSEEDSMFIKILRTMIAAYVKDDEERKKLVRWLDIHCNAYHIPNKLYPSWKPSDEQMADLWNMVCECRPADQQLLQDIYYGLKTLRGE